MASSRTVVLALVASVAATACSKPASQQAANTAPPAPAAPARGSTEWKIADAMSAAPAAISANATIMDYPASDTSQPTRLRAGTNGWTCFPDIPETPADDPVCSDAQWMNWVAAWMTHGVPRVTSIGYAYMLKGADDASNSDPFKMKPDSGQPWVHTGPHVMLLVPRAQMSWLNSLPDTPGPGPFVMFKGTPYAHVMWPVGRSD